MLIAISPTYVPLPNINALLKLVSILIITKLPFVSIQGLKQHTTGSQNMGLSASTCSSHGTFLPIFHLPPTPSIATLNHAEALYELNMKLLHVIKARPRATATTAFFCINRAKPALSFAPWSSKEYPCPFSQVSV